MTFDQMKSLPEKEAKELFSRLDKLRDQTKTVNYSALYGTGAEKLAQTMNISKGRAKTLIDAYWKRNWSVKKVAAEQVVKIIEDKKSRMRGNWLWNPISQSYYSLSNRKDTFSTLNQGTGAYIFDLWLMKFIDKLDTLTGQFHDSAVVMFEPAKRDMVKRIMEEAMEEVNKDVRLNVNIGVDFKFGNDYGFSK